MNFRMQRINLEIKNNISKIINNMNDSRIANKFITIADVNTSPDLYNCKISVGCLSDNENETKNIVKLLNNSTGYIRKELSKIIKIKRIPELYFVVDLQEKTANRIDKILNEIKNKKNDN